jgi:hypothetical protein
MCDVEACTTWTSVFRKRCNGFELSVARQATPSLDLGMGS